MTHWEGWVYIRREVWMPARRGPGSAPLAAVCVSQGLRQEHFSLALLNFHQKPCFFWIHLGQTAEFLKRLRTVRELQFPVCPALTPGSTGHDHPLPPPQDSCGKAGSVRVRVCVRLCGHASVNVSSVCVSR